MDSSSDCNWVSSRSIWQGSQLKKRLKTKCQDLPIVRNPCILLQPFSTDKMRSFKQGLPGPFWKPTQSLALLKLPAHTLQRAKQGDRNCLRCFQSGAGNAPNLQLCLFLTYFLLLSSALQERKTIGTAVQIEIEKGNEETSSRNCQVKSNIRNINKM